jgi:hypothetical protein
MMGRRSSRGSRHLTARTSVHLGGLRICRIGSGLRDGLRSSAGRSAPFAFVVRSRPQLGEKHVSTSYGQSPAAINSFNQSKRHESERGDAALKAAAKDLGQWFHAIYSR